MFEAGSWRALKDAAASCLARQVLKDEADPTIVTFAKDPRRCRPISCGAEPEAGAPNP
jgi:hypothetical protein